MTRLRVSIPGQGGRESDAIALEALDVAAALTIADINLTSGNAEIWAGEHRLARLSKQGGSHATFWRVS